MSAAPLSAQLCTGPVGDDPFGSPNLVIATGGAVYTAGALGNASRIARLDGGAWTVLPGAFDGPVLAIADTPFGLVAGGRFTTVDGVPVARVARLVGGAWLPMDGGVTGGSVVEVRALAVHAGSLYAGGVFARAGGVASANVAAFDGTQWFGLAGGTNGPVDALESHGGELVAAGAFTAAGGASIASVAAWDGTAWTSIGSPLAAVVDLTTAGNRLYAAAGGDLHLLVGNAWVATGDPADVDVRRVAASGDTVMVQGAWNAFCTTPSLGPCLIRARYQGGLWTKLAQDELAPQFASLSMAALGGTFWDTGGTDGLVEHSSRPKLSLATGGVGAWYAETTFTLHGTCIDPLLPIEVTLGDHPPLPGVYEPFGKVLVTVPAGWLEPGSGLLTATLEQGGQTASLEGAFEVQPYLRTLGSTLVLVTANFWVDTPVDSGQAWAFVAASTSPVPLALPGIAGAALLDPTTAHFVMWGNLLPESFAEVHVAAPPGSVPPGLVVPAQALVLEDATPLGPVLSFTNVSMLAF